MKKITLIFVTNLFILGCTQEPPVAPTSLPPTVAPTEVTDSVENTPSEDLVEAEIKEFTLVAQRFIYIPNEIRVKKGDKVKINIVNDDFDHGFAIPDLEVMGVDVVEFTAEEVGEFRFICPSFCGDGHREMGGMLIVE